MKKSTSSNTSEKPLLDKNVEFLMGIYPNGKAVIQLIADEANRRNADQDTVRDYVTLYIKNMNLQHHCFQIEMKPIDANGKKTVEFLTLTNEGKKIVWDNAIKLAQKKPIDYLKWIKVWAMRGDPIAKQKYFEYLHALIDKNIDIMNAMVIPRKLEEIIQHTAIVRKIKFNEDDQISQKLIQNVIELITNGTMMGVIAKTEVSAETSADGTVVEEGYDLFQLTEDGINGVITLYTGIRKGVDGVSSSDRGKKKETLQNFFDLPWQRIFLWVIVAIGIIAIAGFLYFGSQPEVVYDLYALSIENGKMVYTPQQVVVPNGSTQFFVGVIAFVGVFMFLISLSEIRGWIQKFIDKRKQYQKQKIT